MTAADVHIRPAQPGDVPALCSLVERYWQFEGIPGFDAGRVTALLTTIFEQPQRGRVWVARQGDEAVGYLVAVWLLSIEKGGLVAEIDEFFVIDTCRGAGVGAALLQAAESDLRQQGCRNVALQIGRRNTRARRFYADQGYAARDGYDLLDKDL